MRKAKYTREKYKLPLKSRQIISFSSTQVIWMVTLSSKLKRVITKTRCFSMQKTICPVNPRQNTTTIKLNQRRELPLKWRTQGFIK
jgi:hypothetical protein